mmetsp:Transcript_56902/g.176508  ORF Transcript_56902/g.176508 Transcript_56902/m.176508 type:complete len:795 (+) Transcript_56902:103-2487(+)
MQSLAPGEAAVDLQNRSFIASAQHEVHISPDELETINFRMLSSSEKSHGKGFIIPHEIPVDLLRIRVIFTRLREQTRRTPADRDEDVNINDDKVPVEAFQRAFERLFFLLSDPLGFNAKDYDENGDGFVSWGEFFHVYKRRNIKIKPSIFERIFLTFDDPDSSHLAQIVSIVVLMTIVLSSLCFIIGTLPECQTQDPPLSEPKPTAEFETIENICLVLFILEYVARLLTVWDVRSEIFDGERIVELVIGYEPLQRRSPAVRLIKFILSPSNLIDLAAILPALLALVMDQGGGGFVVLRLIRLTRIFRAFKNPALAEPVIVISQTISQSTKALYVLVFNLLLGIVIFGSLMYLAEGQGRWSVEAQTFERKIGQTWNSTSMMWEDDWAPSPFQSIPHTFWWAIVTATTVGYGDHYPTTSLGKVVAVLTMIFSLVILALPVGVIGGTFSQVWDDYKIERRNMAEMRQREMVFITSAIQRLDPTRMSRLMLIEVWNDQDGGEGFLMRPAPARFMGEVTLELELPLNEPISKTQKLRLDQNNELVKRTVTGYITVKYDWVPNGTAIAALAAETGGHRFSLDGDERFQLFGRLTITLISAERLVNLDFTKKNGESNPYCMVLCYPRAPVNGELRPCVWRAPTTENNLNPEFNATHSFEFAWSRQKTVNESVTVGTRGIWSHQSQEPDVHVVGPEPPDQGPLGGAPSSSALASSTAPRLDEVLRMLRELGADLGHVRQEVRSLSSRVDKLSAHADAAAHLAGQHLGPSDSPSPPVDAAPGQIPGEHGDHPVLLPHWVPGPE